MKGKTNWLSLIGALMLVGALVQIFAVPFLLDVVGKNPPTLRKFLHEQLTSQAEFENVNGEGASWFTDGYHANIQFTCSSPVTFKVGEGSIVDKPKLSPAELKQLPVYVRDDPSLIECRVNKTDGDEAKLIHVKGTTQYAFMKFHGSAF